MASNSIKLLTGNSHPQLAELVAKRYDLTFQGFLFLFLFLLSLLSSFSSSRVKATWLVLSPARAEEAVG